MALVDHVRFHKKWFSNATPINANKATATLTFTGVVADGQKVTIGDEVYEFDTNSSVTGTNIPVDVSGGVTASAAVTALVTAIESNSYIVSAADGTGDTVVVTYSWVGTEGNDVGVSTTCTNGSWGQDVTKLSGGTYATPAKTACYIIIDGVWYITNGEVSRTDESGWYSATPAVI